MNFANIAVEVDDEGFFVDPNVWTEEIGTELAAAIGIEALTEDHWTVVKFAREDYATKGETPTLRRVSIGSGVPTKALFQLFPKKPAKKIAYVSGLPKPRGCV
jgi:tRNA 2-thiouridine synthesizing protein E